LVVKTTLYAVFILPILTPPLINVLFKQRRARVREEIRGIIARDYLYFHKRYGMKLSKQELKKYRTWNKKYPPSAWEIERNKRIAEFQGNLNDFVK